MLMIRDQNHEKFLWITHQITQRDVIMAQPPTNSTTPGAKISPAVLFIIVVLSVLFFICGVLHLLVRFLSRNSSSSTRSDESYPNGSAHDSLQRQLQQLFHLHDSGLEQAFIDTLPVFMFKEVMHTKEQFDCAVCLCEFSQNDKLRLLPICSHAFHIGCIDTWLLSNSSCPICRGAIFAPGLSWETQVFDFDDTREDEQQQQQQQQTEIANNGGGNQKPVEIEQEMGPVLAVKLGKFRKLDDVSKHMCESETSSRKLDGRRCYSLGSYQYVISDSPLKVSKGIKIGSPSTSEDLEGKKIRRIDRNDSYSVSKIWLWSKKSKFASSSDPQKW
ncbi:RING-H2 finger protein ATL46-like [Impatiens glandulifera]|uniref:RING-H2 finger protein ATL46-like n=1 Tax=Impatiens glandulifera TaxID=253017 RepID=UPI001FB09A4F|nr:RING-H2 finger protein ATL46-like [Impatiens glandulifera]